MAYNRFSSRDRLRSTYKPIQPTVNFDLLAKSLERQQGLYDEAKDASSKLPEHLQGDADRVAQYKKAQQEKMNNVANIYETRGIQAGNIARKQLMFDTKEDFGPSGEAYNIQQNYRLGTEYRKQLKKAYQDGKIKENVYKASLARSFNDFQSYDEDDQFTQFEGYTPAHFVDVQKKIDDLAKGFEKDALSGGAMMGGRKVYKTMNGQYFAMENNKEVYIKEDDVRQFVRDTARGDVEISGFLAQEDRLFGDVNYTTTGVQRDAKGKPILDENGKPMMETLEHTTSRSQFTLMNIENALANKYGFMQRTSEVKLQADYIYKMNEQHKRDKAIKEMDEYTGHRQTAIYASGLNLLEAPKDSKPYGTAWNAADRALRTSEMNKKTAALAEFDRKNKPSGWNIFGSSANRKYKADRAALEQEFDDSRMAKADKLNQAFQERPAQEALAWYTSPEGKDMFPAVAHELQNQSRRTIIDQDGPRLENDEEYLERAKVKGNALAKEINGQTVVFQEFSGAAQKRKREEFVKNRMAQTYDYTSLSTEGGPSDLKGIRDHLAAAGVKFADNAKGQAEMNKFIDENLSLPGNLTAGNGVGKMTSIVPTGTVVEVGLPNGQTLTLLANDAPMEQKVHALTTQNFARPYYAPHTTSNAHFGKGYGDIMEEVIPMPDGSTIRKHFIAKTNVRYSYDLEGNVTDVDTTPDIYEVTTDDNGKPILKVSKYKDSQGIERTGVRPTSLVGFSSLMANRQNMDTYNDSQIK